MKRNRVIFRYIPMILFAVIFTVFCLFLEEINDNLFILYNNSGLLFSLVLTIVFCIGLYVIIEKSIFYYIIYYNNNIKYIEDELVKGCSLLDQLGTIAPIIGFLGTLVGLIDSFLELGLGGELLDVINGLAVSMTTSLIGAFISIVFIMFSWIFKRISRSIYNYNLKSIKTEGLET